MGEFTLPKLDRPLTGSALKFYFTAMMMCLVNCAQGDDNNSGGKVESNSKSEDDRTGKSNALTGDNTSISNDQSVVAVYAIATGVKNGAQTVVQDICSGVAIESRRVLTRAICMDKLTARLKAQFTGNPVLKHFVYIGFKGVNLATANAPINFLQRMLAAPANEVMAYKFPKADGWLPFGAGLPPTTANPKPFVSVDVVYKENFTAARSAGTINDLAIVTVRDNLPGVATINPTVPGINFPVPAGSDEPILIRKGLSGGEGAAGVTRNGVLSEGPAQVINSRPILEMTGAVGGQQSKSCPLDSGGPLFFSNSSGQQFLAGIDIEPYEANSLNTASNCASGSITTRYAEVAQPEVLMFLSPFLGLPFAKGFSIVNITGQSATLTWRSPTPPNLPSQLGFRYGVLGFPRVGVPETCTKENSRVFPGTFLFPGYDPSFQFAATFPLSKGPWIGFVCLTNPDNTNASLPLVRRFFASDVKDPPPVLISAIKAADIFFNRVMNVTFASGGGTSTGFKGVVDEGTRIPTSCEDIPLGAFIRSPADFAGLRADKPHVLTICALNEDNRFSVPTSVSFRTPLGPAIPKTPINLNLKPGHNTAVFSWDKPAGSSAVRYRVGAKLPPSPSSCDVTDTSIPSNASSDTTSFKLVERRLDGNSRGRDLLLPNTTYVAYVCALNSVGDNSPLASKEFTTLAPPSPPQPISVAVTPRSRSAKITWKRVTPEIEGYIIGVSATAANADCKGSNVRTVTDASLLESKIIESLSPETTPIQLIELASPYFAFICSKSIFGAISAPVIVPFKSAGPPPVPTNLEVVKVGANGIKLTWASGGDGTSAFIAAVAESEAKVNCAVPTLQILPNTTLTSSRFGLVVGKTYVAYVCSRDSDFIISKPVMRTFIR